MALDRDSFRYSASQIQEDFFFFFCSEDLNPALPEWIVSIKDEAGAEVYNGVVLRLGGLWVGYLGKYQEW